MDKDPIEEQVDAHLVVFDGGRCILITRIILAIVDLFGGSGAAVAVIAARALRTIGAVAVGSGVALVPRPVTAAAALARPPHAAHPPPFAHAVPAAPPPVAADAIHEVLVELEEAAGSARHRAELQGASQRRADEVAPLFGVVERQLPVQQLADVVQGGGALRVLEPLDRGEHQPRGFLRATDLRLLHVVRDHPFCFLCQRSILIFLIIIICDGEF